MVPPEIKIQKETVKCWTSIKIRQLYASITSLLPIASVGAIIGYSSILLPQLAEPGSIVQLNPTTISWIASIAVLPLAPLGFLSGFCMAKIGRKMTHFIMCVFLTFGWLLIGFSNDLAALLTGRFLCGIGMGFQGPLSSVFIGETTSPKSRHIYLSLISTLLAFGVLWSHLLGTYLQWKTVAFICTVFSFIAGVMIIPIPDTPSWYLNRGRIDKSSQVFHWYRGNADKANEELDKMIEKKTVEIISQNKENSKKISTFSKKMSEIKSVMKREFLKPLLILCLFFFQMQISGNNVISFYSVDIIKNILNNGTNPYTVMLVIDLIRLLSTVFTSSIVLKYFGRRTATMVSGVMVFASLTGLSVFIYLQKNGYLSNNDYWISLLFLSFYIIALSFGIIPLPWSLLGELLPANLRGQGAGISVFFTCISIFAVTKTAPFMMNIWGLPLTFTFYGTSTLILTLIIWVMLPETKGKTLQEIEDHFKRKTPEVRQLQDVQTPMTA